MGLFWFSVADPQQEERKGGGLVEPEVESSNKSSSLSPIFVIFTVHYTIHMDVWTENTDNIMLNAHHDIT